ncbi:uncharacterized protein GGS22DRAFT_72950 [Annulohypoxylon maeteangense]|uniref:uncharacterized protein n=1 Tax=Annulohypoxylon maeteangense TaxID=1927788 RepID=UPI0020078CEE|nr:uncharacterized protein GGS22DRAFT_72950 [Annulohypoxylon maeteangense]KAI0881243.1 hypothetical protein GGS22DRAFT_72950 [Annulohypoxylon maeteangense]
MGAMKDTNDDLSANPTVTQQYQQRLSTARSSHSYGSYETGESSAPPSLNDPSNGSTTSAHSPHKSATNDLNSNSYALDQRSRGMDKDRDRDLNHEVHKRRRPHKPRSSGGFLLANTSHDEPSKGVSPNRDGSRRQSRLPVDNRKGKTSMSLSTNLSDRSNGANLRTGLGIDEQGMRRSSEGLPSRIASPAPDDERRYNQGGRRVSRIPTPTSRPGTPLDVDSTNIVNMALNLSESRRMAERRNMSSPIPPRLAQLPDTLAGGSLKQHLQQQRRTSRTLSPKPDRSLVPRAVSTTRIPSPLQPSFDSEGSYTYHFSSSTLNRAQKAKEYLELMAQYRRLLQIVAPLKPDARSRPSSSNLSTSPTSSKPPLNPLTGTPQIVLGRAYNPLQYIRNRKVRARERKIIDGWAQGFADISRVSCWIDQTAASTATSDLSLGPSLLPPFQAAHEADQEPPSNIPRPISTIAKPKRIRIDWSIDPADMLADIYWIEQDDNKYLIEDRHYSKIFPRKLEAQSPPRQINEPVASALSVSTREGDMGDITAASEVDLISPLRAESDVPLISARERARQKLQDLRGHHKQNGLSHSHHDFLRFRKGSLSDTSDSESDRRRRNRTGTISADGTDLLDRQMKEMMAKEEQNEKENMDEANRVLLKQLPSRMVTPDKGSQTPEEISRRGSRVEVLDGQDKLTRGKAQQGSPLGSALGSGRASLEVPGKNYRMSLDMDSSRPQSPDARPSRGRRLQAPAIGMEPSPPNSRPGSPGRKPFSKVKNIFRDRSRDRERERERGANNVIREKVDRVDSPIEPPEQLNLSALTTERFQSPDRRRSKSLSRKMVQRATGESHRSHKSVSSISKMKGDDQVGLRSIFKGSSKLDGMIRGSVSKVTDLLWKKDSDTEDGSSTSTNSESEAEPKRGRAKGSTNASRSNSRRPRENNRQKNYLEVMPPFKQTLLLPDKPSSEEIDPLTVVSPISRPSRSPRFDRLKPPRIDIRKASPPSTDLVPTKSRLLRDSSDVSDLEIFPVIQGEKLHGLSKETSVVLAAPKPRPRMGSRTLSQPARHWSISNRSQSPQGGQISRREVARLRALILCSGIKAMEISRRAHEPHPLFALDNNNKGLVAGLTWSDVARFVPDQKTMGLLAPELELFPATAGVVITSIENSIRLSEKSTARFATETARVFQRRIEGLHDRVAGDLMEMTHRAADEADEVNRDLVDSQRLKVKTVTDTMDKMLRRRRRRFRWARRAGWLAVEWVLVGFMWYVWFVVMLTRIVLGVGKGILGVGRWLLWL